MSTSDFVIAGRSFASWPPVAITKTYSLEGRGRRLIRAANGTVCSSRQLVRAVPFLSGTHEVLGVDSIPRGMHPNDLGDDVAKSLSRLVQDQTDGHSLGEGVVTA